MEKIKHYFASANTGNGFCNFFEYINNKNESGFLYVIKGSSGSGKSTMMKKIGEHFSNLEHEVEYFHCSSDISSLDGVRIVDLNIAIVDGTAPHVTEANLPSIKDKIINIGEYIGNEVAQYEKEIVKIITEKKQYFDMCYLYIKSAKKLFEVNSLLLSKNLKEIKINNKINKIKNKLNIKKINKKGFKRNLFETAIDIGGEVSIPNKNNYAKTIYLDDNQLVNSKILEGLAKKTINYGYDCTIFYELLSPDIVKSIFLPELDTYICQKASLKDCSQEIIDNVVYNNIQINSLLEKAGLVLQNARDNHLNVEKYYIKNINFNGVDELKDKIIKEIETRAIP